MADPYTQAALGVAKGMAEGTRSGTDAGIAQLKALAAQEDQQAIALELEERRLRIQGLRQELGEVKANEVLRIEAKREGLLAQGHEDRIVRESHEYLRSLPAPVQAKIRGEMYRHALGINDIEAQRAETELLVARTAKIDVEAAKIKLMAPAELKALLATTRKQELANQVAEDVNPSKIALDIAKNNAQLPAEEIKALITARVAQDLKERLIAYDLDPASDPSLREAFAYALDDELGIVDQTLRYYNSLDSRMERYNITERERYSGATATQQRVLRAGYDSPEDAWSDLSLAPMGNALEGGGPGYPIYKAPGELTNAIAAAMMFEELRPEFGPMHSFAKKLAIETYLSNLVIPVGTERAAARDENFVTIHKPWAVSLELTGEDVSTLKDVGTGRDIHISGEQVGTFIRVPVGDFLTALDVKAASNLNAEAHAANPALAVLQSGTGPNILAMDMERRLHNEIQPYVSDVVWKRRDVVLRAMEGSIAAARTDPPAAELPAPDAAPMLSADAIASMDLLNLPPVVRTQETAALTMGHQAKISESLALLKDHETAVQRMDNLGPHYDQRLEVPGMPELVLTRKDKSTGIEYYESLDGSVNESYSPEQIQRLKDSGGARIRRGPHYHALSGHRLPRLAHMEAATNPALRAQRNATFDREYHVARVSLLQLIQTTIGERTMGMSPDRIEATIIQEIMDNTTPRERYYLAASQNEDRSRQLRNHVVNGTPLPEWADLLSQTTMPVLLRVGLQIDPILRSIRPVLDAVYAEEQRVIREVGNVYMGPEIEGGEQLTMESPTTHFPLAILAHQSTELIGQGIDAAVEAGDAAKEKGSYGGKEAWERGKMAPALERGIVVDIPTAISTASELNNPGLLQFSDMLRKRAQATKSESGLAQFPTPELGFQGLFEHTMTNTLRAGQTLDTYLTNYGRAIAPTTGTAPAEFSEQVMGDLAKEYGGYEPSTRLHDVDTTALARILARIISGTAIDIDIQGPS